MKRGGVIRSSSYSFLKATLNTKCYFAFFRLNLNPKTSLLRYLYTNTLAMENYTVKKLAITAWAEEDRPREKLLHI